jgi:hypothetical protein
LELGKANYCSEAFNYLNVKYDKEATNDGGLSNYCFHMVANTLRFIENGQRKTNQKTYTKLFLKKAGKNENRLPKMLCFDFFNLVGLEA